MYFLYSVLDIVFNHNHGPFILLYSILDIVFDLNALVESVENKMNNFLIEQATTIIMSHCTMVNKYLTVKEPWKIKDNPEARAKIIRSTIESIYILAHFLQPFIPGVSFINISSMKI